MLYFSIQNAFRAPDEHFLLKNTTFPAPAIFPNFTKYCACHEKCHLTFTKYCACHEKGSWPSPSTAPVTKSDLDLHQVLRLSRKVTLDLHQVLRLPHRMTRMLDPRHIWSVISNARSNKCHPPNSPNTAPATQNDHPTSTRNLMKTAETSFPTRGRSEHDPRPFREWTRQSATRHANRVTFRAPDEYFLLKNKMFRAPAIFPNSTKYCACHAKWHFNFTKYCVYHEKSHLNFTKYCAYHEKWHLNFTKYCACHEKTLELHQVLRLPRKVTLDLHQVLRLPHRMTRRLDPRHIWNVISNARSNKCHPPNSPNTAPATQNDHPTSGRNLMKTAETSFPMRGRSDHDPTMIRAWSEHDPRPFPSVRNPPRNRGYFSRSGLAFCIEKCNISSSSYLSKFHQVLRLPRKVTLELHQVLRLPRKVTLELHPVLRLPRKVTLDLHQVLRLPHRMTRRLDPRHIWNVISNARSNKCHPPNSPNTAPATQNDHPTSTRNLMKTAETSFPMRGRSDHDPSMIRAWSETVPVSPQPATQQRLLFALRTSILYWKMQHFELSLSFQISPSTAPATQSDTSTSPSTAPATQSDTSTSPSTAPTTKSDTWTSPSTAPTTKSDTWTSPSTAPATKSDTWTSPSTAPATKSDSINWLYYYAAILIDSTITQRF